jgi:hypothetical protein
MYYKILSGGQSWYSKEIVKAHLRCGDDMIQRKLMDGSIKSCQILDRFVYSIPGEKESKLDRAFSPVVQNLDAVINGFSPYPCCKEFNIFRYDLKEPVLSYDKFKFVRFSAVHCKSKYRDQHKFPVLEVCGTKYVALNCFKADESFIVQ